MLKLVSTEHDEGNVVKNYKCDFIVSCDGSSIWSDTSNVKVHVTGISVMEDLREGYKSITVEHDKGWEIYTDEGFEQAISSALGFTVMFTEQGMQDNGLASMEA